MGIYWGKTIVGRIIKRRVWAMLLAFLSAYMLLFSQPINAPSARASRTLTTDLDIAQDDHPDPAQIDQDRTEETTSRGSRINHVFESQKLTANDAAPGKYFGHAVAIQNNTALIGGSAGSGSSWAYAFNNNGTNWVQSAKFIGSGITAGEAFGKDLDIDGDTLIVSAPSDVDSLYFHTSRQCLESTGQAYSQ